MEGEKQTTQNEVNPHQDRQNPVRTLINRSLTEDTAMVSGFVVILILMSLIISIGLGRMEAIQSRLDHIVDNHMTKIDLVHQMRVAARERTVSLQKMALLQDPFERDEAWMRFNALATKFLEARAEFLAMNLSPEEDKLLKVTFEHVQEAADTQNQVVDAITAEQPSRASKLLLAEAVPAQNRVLGFLIQLRKLQEKSASEAVAEADQSYARARNWMIFLSTCAFCIALLIAYLVTRKSKRAMDSLAQEKEKAQVTLHSIGDGVITTDARGFVEYLNEVAIHLTGWPLDQAVGKPVEDIFSVYDDHGNTGSRDLIESAIAMRQPISISGDIRLITRTCDEYVVEATAAPIVSQEKKIMGTTVVFRDVSEMHALSSQLRYRASHDDMTGLHNRTEFEARLQGAIDATRTEDIEHAFCFIDLDLFKIVNDSSGHAAGDELLRQISSLLKKHVRRNDVLARLGGDEFAILLEGCSLKRAEEIADHIRQEIYSFRFVWEDKSYQLGVSIGLVSVSSLSGTVSDVLKAGDVALNIAKEQGRNRVHVLDADRHSVEEREIEVSWIDRINESLDKKGFRLYAQRIISLKDSGPDRYEILLRMVDKDGKIIAPGAFLPAAERYQMMSRIDRWVVRRSLATISENFSDPESARPCIFSINLSGQSLSDPDFVGFIYEQLNSFELDPEMICFEITETTAISNLSVASELIAEVKERGCMFALDDFGSGLSSFAYLKGLAVDALKIDGSLVKDMGRDDASRAMVKSINEVAHALDLQTVAEYLEDEELITLATAVGIDYGQGYGIAKPEPIESVIERYQDITQARKVAAKN